MDAPIIFIHYGDSYYLKYTLESAVVSNPGKHVILLGDPANAHYAALGIEHCKFADYSSGAELVLFDKVYQFIAGREHQRKEWTRFVFRRWFNIYCFILARGYQRFWTFDSDTLILSDLSLQEQKFAAYDCTEQCSGTCMNGLITNTRVVKGYLDLINSLFVRRSFLRNERKCFRYYPKYAFTEMKAYVVYREESGIRRIRLSTIIDGESFLDSICTIDEHRRFFFDDDYEIYNDKVWRFDLKKIYLRSDGTILFLHKASGRLVKMNTINMSWTPGWLIRALLQHSKFRPGASMSSPVVEHSTQVLDLNTICTEKSDLS